MVQALFLNLPNLFHYVPIMSFLAIAPSSFIRYLPILYLRRGLLSY